MNKMNNIFLKKKILIYGLGKSGISTYNFLRQKAKVNLFDDNPQIISDLIKKVFLSPKYLNVILIL